MPRPCTHDASQAVLRLLSTSSFILYTLYAQAVLRLLSTSSVAAAARRGHQATGPVDCTLHVGRSALVHSLPSALIVTSAPLVSPRRRPPKRGGATLPTDSADLLPSCCVFSTAGLSLSPFSPIPALSRHSHSVSPLHLVFQMYREVAFEKGGSKRLRRVDVGTLGPREVRSDYIACAVGK